MSILGSEMEDTFHSAGPKVSELYVCNDTGVKPKPLEWDLYTTAVAEIENWIGFGADRCSCGVNHDASCDHIDPSKRTCRVLSSVVLISDNLVREWIHSGRCCEKRG